MKTKFTPKKLSDAEIAAMKSAPPIEGFRSVEFFRTVKEKMAKATEGMTLQEERNYWKLMRDGKVKLDYDFFEETPNIAAEPEFEYRTKK